MSKGRSRNAESLDLQKHEPERLILRIPKWLWLPKWFPVVGGFPAFCMPRKNVKRLIPSWAFAVFFTIASYYLGVYYWGFPFFSLVIIATVLAIISIKVFLVALPSIFIRKDCSECRLGFHIVTHERNHLLLNSSDEILVEKETLEQTKTQLIPILLSGFNLCEDCGRWFKLYSQAPSNYLNQRKPLGYPKKES